MLVKSDNVMKALLLNGSLKNDNFSMICSSIVEVGGDTV